jgi:hypothetical protein
MCQCRCGQQIGQSEGLDEAVCPTAHGVVDRSTRASGIQSCPTAIPASDSSTQPAHSGLAALRENGVSSPAADHSLTKGPLQAFENCQDVAAKWRLLFQRLAGDGADVDLNVKISRVSETGSPLLVIGISEAGEKRSTRVKL